ncbi:MAG: hypothetical protein WCE64_10180 [Bacteroidales bacterium]
MSKEENKSNNGNILLKVIGSLIGLFLIYFSIMSVMAPARKLAELKSEYAPKSSAADDEKFYSDSAYVSLVKQKAFLQSRVAMAKTDSIYMTLNLADSTANLEISGVTVHSAKITSFRISSIFRQDNNPVILSLLSSPLNIVSDLSTIKKEPLMVKMAPKDTSEYKPDIVPDTTDFEPVNFVFVMDNGIELFVYQDPDTTKGDQRQFFLFDLNDRLKNTWQSLKSVAKFRIPDYHPFIKLRMGKADAKIFYRALPRKGQVAVFL